MSYTDGDECLGTSSISVPSICPLGPIALPLLLPLPRRPVGAETGYKMTMSAYLWGLIDVWKSIYHVGQTRQRRCRRIVVLQRHDSLGHLSNFVGSLLLLIS